MVAARGKERRAARKEQREEEAAERSGGCDGPPLTLHLPGEDVRQRERGGGGGGGALRSLDVSFLERHRKKVTAAAKGGGGGKGAGRADEAESREDGGRRGGGGEGGGARVAEGKARAAAGGGGAAEGVGVSVIKGHVFTSPCILASVRPASRLLPGVASAPHVLTNTIDVGAVGAYTSCFRRAIIWGCWWSGVLSSMRGDAPPPPTRRRRRRWRRPCGAPASRRRAFAGARAPTTIGWDGRRTPRSPQPPVRGRRVIKGGGGFRPNHRPARRRRLRRRRRRPLPIPKGLHRRLGRTAAVVPAGDLRPSEGRAAVRRSTGARAGPVEEVEGGGGGRRGCAVLRRQYTHRRGTGGVSLGRRRIYSARPLAAVLHRVRHRVVRSHQQGFARGSPPSRRRSSPRRRSCWGSSAARGSAAAPPRDREGEGISRERCCRAARRRWERGRARPRASATATAPSAAASAAAAGTPAGTPRRTCPPSSSSGGGPAATPPSSA